MDGVWKTKDSRSKIIENVFIHQQTRERGKDCERKMEKLTLPGTRKAQIMAKMQTKTALIYLLSFPQGGEVKGCEEILQ